MNDTDYLIISVDIRTYYKKYFNYENIYTNFKVAHCLTEKINPFIYIILCRE